MLWYVLFSILGALLLLIVFLLICNIAVSPKKYYTKDCRFYRCLVNALTAATLKVGRVKLHVSGCEKLPKGKKLLFVGNHLSNFDPMVTFYACRPWRLSYIAKDTILKMPLFGRYIRRCCFMDIDRENPRNALVTINRAAELLKAEAVSIGVYPEGTRSKTGDLLPFHNGVFKIAQKAEADIAVVSLCGTNEISKNFPLKKTHVYVDIIEVIPSSEIARKKTDVIGQHVAERLCEHKRKRVFEK
jgi:1-acyl-sn-glycerol-3-phosphate acyltransferase